jgi:hypothetical protein
MIRKIRMRMCESGELAPMAAAAERQSCGKGLTGKETLLQSVQLQRPDSCNNAEARNSQAIGCKGAAEAVYRAIRLMASSLAISTIAQNGRVRVTLWSLFSFGEGSEKETGKMGGAGN